MSKWFYISICLITHAIFEIMFIYSVYSKLKREFKRWPIFAPLNSTHLINLYSIDFYDENSWKWVKYANMRILHVILQFATLNNSTATLNRSKGNDQQKQTEIASYEWFSNIHNQSINHNHHHSTKNHMKTLSNFLLRVFNKNTVSNKKDPITHDL